MLQTNKLAYILSPKILQAVYRNAVPEGLPKPIYTQGYKTVTVFIETHLHKLINHSYPTIGNVIMSKTKVQNMHFVQSKHRNENKQLFESFLWLPGCDSFCSVLMRWNIDQRKPSSTQHTHTHILYEERQQNKDLFS